MGGGLFAVVVVVLPTGKVQGCHTDASGIDSTNSAQLSIERLWLIDTVLLIVTKLLFLHSPPPPPPSRIHVHTNNLWNTKTSSRHCCF